MTPNSAVRCLSARVSAAVNPANIATFPIGSIVVQRVAKSLLILIRSGDIFSVCGNHRRTCNLSSAALPIFILLLLFTATSPSPRDQGTRGKPSQVRRGAHGEFG